MCTHRHTKAHARLLLLELCPLLAVSFTSCCTCRICSFFCTAVFIIFVTNCLCHSLTLPVSYFIWQLIFRSFVAYLTLRKAAYCTNLADTEKRVSQKSSSILMPPYSDVLKDSALLSLPISLSSVFLNPSSSSFLYPLPSLHVVSISLLLAPFSPPLLSNLIWSQFVDAVEWDRPPLCFSHMYTHTDSRPVSKKPPPLVTPSLILNYSSNVIGSCW